MWYVRDVLYAVLYVCVCSFVVHGCAVYRKYIDVCYCDMFSVVNVYLYHLKFCVVCINGRSYVCCGECGTGQVGLGVGSWPSNRATEGSNPKGTRLYFVILLKNVEKIFDWH